jgi:hypothetical protein
VNTGQSPFQYNSSFALSPMYNKVKAVAKLPTNDKSKIAAALAIQGDRLFLHFSQGLDCREIAVFNADNLQFVERLDLSATIESKVLKSEDSNYFFEYDISEGSNTLLNLRATNGYEIAIVDAFIGNDSVLEFVNSLANSEFTSYFARDLRNELENFHSFRRKLAASCVLKINCKCIARKANELRLPITCSEDHIYVIEETNGSATTGKRLYDPLRDLQWKSATAENSSGLIVDVLSKVSQLWVAFLETIHNNGIKGDDPKVNLANFISIMEELGTYDDQHQETATGDLNESKLNLSFSIGIDNKKGSLVFAENCNWQLLLSELEDALDHRTPLFNALKISLDKSTSKSILVSRIPLLTPGYDALNSVELNSSSLLCNNHQLMILCPEMTSADIVRAKGWKFSLDLNGEIQRFYSKVFAKNCGTPTSFCFDASNNMIVGFDTNLFRVLKWRNAGFSPSLSSVGVPNTTITENVNIMLLEGSAATRLAYLYQQFKVSNDFALQVPILLSLLDKLSEPYGNNPFESNANIDALSQIKLTAKTKKQSGIEKDWCSISIRDQLVEFDDDSNDEPHRGFHIVVLNRTSYSIEKSRWFDTSDTERNNSNRLGDFLNDQPERTVIVVTCVGSLSDGMGRYAYDALMNYGCCDLEPGAKQNSSLVMIGVKGLKPGSADYKLGISGTQIQIVRFLPPRAIPLKLDPSANAITALLHLSKHFLKNSQDKGVLSQLCFSATLRLLQVNLYNFTHRSKPEDALTAFAESSRGYLKHFLEELLMSDLMQILKVRNTAVGLFVAALALVYPSNEDQIVLLDSIVSKYRRNSISEAELSLLQVLLRRFLHADDLITVSKSGKLDYDNVHKLITVVMFIIQQETELLVLHMSQKPHGAYDSPIYSTAVGLLETLSKLMLAFAAEPLVKRSETAVTSTSDTMQIFNVVSIVSKLSSDILRSILRLKEDHGKLFETSKILEILHHSPVGMILPITIMTISELIRNGGYKLISLSMESVLVAIHDVDECLSWMNLVLAQLSIEARSYSDDVPQNSTVIKVFESGHPYQSSMDERTPISFPGALSISISFDTQTRTEEGCDFLQFLDMNGNSLHPDIERFSGRNGSEVGFIYKFLLLDVLNS